MENILILPGDGIGPEVMGEVARIIDWFGTHKSLDVSIDHDLVGGCAYDAHGAAISDAAMEKALAADAVQASIGNCIFNGGTYGIVGSSTARTSPATRRGILVQSTNRFEGVSTDIVQKSQSANVIGDKAATTPALDSQTASDTILFVAPRKGWLTGVTLSFPDAGGNGTTASTFTVYKTNGGGSTKLIDATVTKDASQYDIEFWGSEHAQIEVNKFAAGDIIRVVCDGAEDAQTLFQIGLDWFEYDD